MTIVRWIGPLAYMVRTRDCASINDVRALWRLSWKSYAYRHYGESITDYVRHNPDKDFRRLRREEITSAYDYAERLADSDFFFRSTVVKINIGNLQSRRDVVKAFRLIEKYEQCGRYVDRAVRLVRQWENDGLECDDYAAILDGAISELVNRRY